MNLVFRCCLLVWLGIYSGWLSAAASPNSSDGILTSSPRSIPWSDVGPIATTAHAGAGLEVLALPGGSLRISCAFQRLEGDITPEGLWLTSTSPGTPHHRFRAVAHAVSRDGCPSRADLGAWVWSSALPHDEDNLAAIQCEREGGRALPHYGSVALAGDRVQFVRPGLLEEYSVSVDGVRQDFVVEQPPAGFGELRLELALSGTTAEMGSPGSSLVLSAGGRRIAYSRLRVTDARGAELPARMEATSPHRLAVVVDDSGAAYPVRIDPTFSDANWVSMGGVDGVDGIVNAILPEADGTLIIGGSFASVRNTLANNIARWDGSSWQALGQGTDSAVFSLARLRDDLFVGGAFTNAGGQVANGIARWNGASWLTVGTGVSNAAAGRRSVNSLVIWGNSLYAGGRFTAAGGVTASNIARWNGVVWSPVGSGLNGEVFTLAPAGLSLYAGGLFRTAGSVAVNSVARWNGTAWSALGKGVGGDAFQPNFVITLAVSGTTLYAGGTFLTAGDVPAKRIARWNGTAWSALGTGIDGNADLGIGVSSLALLGNTLYAGGSFTSAGGVSVFNFAKWSGTSWSAVTATTAGRVGPLVVSKTNLLVGADVALPGGRLLRGLAKMVGNSWTNVDTEVPLGTDAPVLALVQAGTNLVAGGSFTTAGGRVANRVAAWSGGGWTNVGPGFNGPVAALINADGGLYAGGSFNRAGTLPAGFIARWSGGRWSSLGQGFIVPVTALAATGGDLYAAGAAALTIPTSAQVGRWDGFLWRILGPGFTSSTGGEVHALSASDGTLYAGGRFTGTGKTTVQNIARWDGTAWQPVGTGLNATVRSLLRWNGNLVAGGDFTQTAGTTNRTALSRISEWTGAAWNPIGLGANGPVHALAVAGSRLVVGGAFTQVTNATGQMTPAKCVAIWDGTEWSALGSGLNGTVVALSVSGLELTVGGHFTAAGGKVSRYAAKAILPRETKISGLLLAGNQVTLTFTGDPAQTYDVQRNETLGAPDWLTINLSPLRPDTEGRLNFVDPETPPGAAYYRIVEH